MWNPFRRKNFSADVKLVERVIDKLNARQLEFQHLYDSYADILSELGETPAFWDEKRLPSSKARIKEMLLNRLFFAQSEYERSIYRDAYRQLSFFLQGIGPNGLRLTKEHLAEIGPEIVDFSIKHETERIRIELDLQRANEFIDTWQSPYLVKENFTLKDLENVTKISIAIPSL